MSRARAQVKNNRPSGTRAAACAEFARKKAHQKRRDMQRRSMAAVAGILLTASAAGMWWLERQGTFEAVMEQASQGFWQHTAALGFDVQQVYVQGRKFADRAAIEKAIDAKKGAPILALDLQEMKTALEAIPEIRRASVQRMLPHHVAVRVHERVPVAIWQKQGVQHLIDRDGVVLNSAKYAGNGSLPVLVGEDAPTHAASLIHMLATQPELQTHIVSAVRVGARRWNLQLSNKVTVMLPEEGALRAWKRFAQLVQNEGILTRAVRAIDLRLEDRIFITPMDQKATPVAYQSANDA